MRWIVPVLALAMLACSSGPTPDMDASNDARIQRRPDGGTSDVDVVLPCVWVGCPVDDAADVAGDDSADPADAVTDAPDPADACPATCAAMYPTCVAARCCYATSTPCSAAESCATGGSVHVCGPSGTWFCCEGP